MIAYLLRNDKDPGAALGITIDTWNKILNLAEVHGWRPVGMVGRDFRDLNKPLAGVFLGRPLLLQEEVHREKIGFVVLEDALNLADALDRAFLAYEPDYLPAGYFFFKNQEIEDRLLPSIGAIREVIEFCKRGSFWIEPFRNSNQKS